VTHKGCHQWESTHILLHYMTSHLKSLQSQLYALLSLLLTVMEESLGL